MRFFKLKTPWLALVFSVVAVGLHIGIGYLIHARFGRSALADFWQHSISFYWPAFDVIRILGFIQNLGPLMATIAMIITAWVQWWIIFAVAIWLVRLYSRKPPVSKMRRIVAGVTVVAVGVYFYIGILETLGMSKYQRFRFDVSAGHLEKVRETLKSNPSFANKMQRGWGTPLHLAAEMGHVEIAKLLLDNGADVNAVGIRGFTPLHSAAWSGRTDVAKVLIAHGANVNAGDENGETPLVWASGAGHTNTIILLLDSGADVNARDKFGNCPLSSAIVNN